MSYCKLGQDILESIPDLIRCGEPDSKEIATVIKHARMIYIDEVADYIDAEFKQSIKDRVFSGEMDEYILPISDFMWMEFISSEDQIPTGLLIGAMPDGDKFRFQIQLLQRRHGGLFAGDKIAFWVDPNGGGLATTMPLHILNGDPRVRDAIVGQMWYVIGVLIMINSKVVDSEEVKFPRHLRKGAFERSGVPGARLKSFGVIHLDGHDRPKRESGESDCDFKARCLHYCRAHLRLLPSGKLTRVRGHWRGSASIGENVREYRMKRPPL